MILRKEFLLRQTSKRQTTNILPQEAGNVRALLVRTTGFKVRIRLGDVSTVGR